MKKVCSALLAICIALALTAAPFAAYDALMAKTGGQCEPEDPLPPQQDIIPTTAPTCEPEDPLHPQQDITPTLPSIKYYLGDVDGDTETTIIDASYIQRYNTRIPVPFTDEEMLHGDVDGDGEATMLDATCIQRYSTHINVPYPIGEAVR